MDTNTYYIYLQSSIPNTNANISIPSLKISKIIMRLKINSTNDSTLWQFSNDCNDTKLEAYCAITKLKDVVEKLETIIFLCNFV